MAVDQGSTGVEFESLTTVAQEIGAALGIESLQDARLASLSSYPVADKLRWIKDRRGVQSKYGCCWCCS
jgi:hypothetical protein